MPISIATKPIAMQGSKTNPFAHSDVDRRQIWAMLVEHDIEAFLAADWQKVENDFDAAHFVGYSGPSNPDDWRIAYPSIQAYRNDWLRQAEEFSLISLKSMGKVDFLYVATTLEQIEISEDRAMAHKKFDGHAETTSGTELVLNWQTVCWLRRDQGGWRITGFLGYARN